MNVDPKAAHNSGLYSALLIVAFIVFLAKLNIANIYQINWDEFFFLSKIYDYLRADLWQVLQTFHVHFFTWLPLISNNEAEQIVAARFVMVAFQVFTAISLYRIGRCFFSKSSALFVVLAYFSVSYVLLLGADFRADPLAGFFSVASIDLALNIRRGWGWAAGAALSASIALMITIKSAFYLPVIGLTYLVVLGSADNTGRIIRLGLVAVGSGMVAVMVLYSLHQMAIGDVAKTTDALVGGAYQKTISSQGFFPRWHFFSESLKKDAVYWGLLSAGFLLLFRELISPQKLSRWQSGAILVLALPLITFLFYRNAFPYYYAFILATPSILAGLVWEYLVFSESKWARTTAKILLAVVAFVILYTGAIVPFKKNMHAQQEMLAVIHELFPEPVSYIDRCSMVSSYKKEGFFMSTWGTENYRASGKPIFESLIEREQPKFLVANKPTLDILIPDEIRRRFIHQDYDLFESDLAVLRKNYIPHWGKLYVAGKYIVVNNPGSDYKFNIAIEGSYTFESTVEAIVNGERLTPGGLITLRKGLNTLKAGERGVYVFRWGDHLPVPTHRAGEGYLFGGF